MPEATKVEVAGAEVAGGCIVQPQLFIASPPVIEIEYAPDERDRVFKEIWDNLSQKDVSEYVEKKGVGARQLSYLPWSDCYSIITTEYPNTEYHTYWFPQEQEGGHWQRTFKEGSGYSVQVGITIKGIHKYIALPVMVGIPPKAVEQIDSFMVNTAIQRCGVKAASRFGLALYLYQGEDLPVDKPKVKPEVLATDEQKKLMFDLQKQLAFDDEGLKIGIKKAIGVSVAVANLTTSQADVVIAKMKEGLKRRSK